MQGFIYLLIMGQTGQPANNGLTDSIAGVFAVNGTNIFAGTSSGVYY